MAANVNNYVSAGNSAVRKAIMARKALADNKARLDEIGMEAVAQDAKNRVNVAKNNSLTAQQAMQAKTDVKLTDIKIQSDKDIAGIKSGARKAGMLAGGVALLGAGAMQMNKKDEPDSMLSHYANLRDKYNTQLGEADDKITAAQEHLDSFNGSSDSTKPDPNKLNPGSTDSPDIETAPVPQGNVDTNTASSNSGDSGSLDFKGIVAMATKAGAKHPQLVAAQWALESGWGKTPSGKNNYFGIKATSGEAGTSKQTWEVYGGQEVTETARFKDFATPQDSVNDLVNKWHKDYNGYSGVNRGQSAYDAAGLLVQEGYATDPNYAEKLRKIMRDQGY